jgi:hypothetical protein
MLILAGVEELGATSEVLPLETGDTVESDIVWPRQRFGRCKCI